MRHNGVFVSQQKKQLYDGVVKKPAVLRMQGSVCGVFGRLFYGFL